MSNQSQLTGPVVIAAQGIREESSSALHSIGAYVETNDGRGFRYAKVGAVATVAGKVYQGPAEDTTNQNPSGGLSVAAAAIGATEVVTTSTVTLAADLLAGGFLAVVVTPGAGYTYRIQGNTVASAAVVTFTLDDPLEVALTTSSKVIVAQNPYNGVLIEPGTPTAKIVGVAPTIITAAYFGWLQTRGPASVLFTGTGAAGKVVGSLTGGTSGSMAPAIAATNIGGEHMGTGITGEYALVYLNID